MSNFDLGQRVGVCLSHISTNWSHETHFILIYFTVLFFYTWLTTQLSSSQFHEERFLGIKGYVSPITKILLLPPTRFPEVSRMAALSEAYVKGFLEECFLLQHLVTTQSGDPEALLSGANNTPSFPAMLFSHPLRMASSQLSNTIWRLHNPILEISSSGVLFRRNRNDETYS